MNSSISLTFEWNTPTGSDTEIIIVDNYTISIRNIRISSYDVVDEMASTPWNVTDLSYNVEYEAILTASNCAGESSPIILTRIYYGKT